MCDPILVTSENVNPLHYSQFSHENVAPSSGTFPLASYKEVAPLPAVVWSSGESTCLPPVWLGIKEEIWFKLPAQQICHLLMPAKHRIKESQFDSCLISRVKSQVYSLKTNPNENKTGSKSWTLLYWKRLKEVSQCMFYMVRWRLTD